MKTKLTTLMLLFSLSFALFACTSESKKVLNKKLPFVQIDTTSAKILTITKVKKPWYAWRSLVAKKMKQSIPEYQAINGLLEKFYSFTDNNKLFGGIYQWKSEADAKAWFNQAWFDRTEKLYGIKGTVEYYQILSEETIAQYVDTVGEYWSVLSFNDSIIEQSAFGLIKVVKIVNEKNQYGTLTLWQNNESAVAYFKKQPVTYFDTPILLTNKK
jgi:heme-degrading monooxygenase HmoA